MSSRRVVALDAGPGALPLWADALATALDGSGPALVPLPTGPEAGRKLLTAALRPDDPDAPLESDQVALVVPTSGSTGVPKGAMLTAGALRASASATHARLAGPGRWVLALPLTHIAGLMVVVRALEAGRLPWQVTGTGEFDPEGFAATTASAATQAATDGLPLYTSLVPTQLRRLLDGSAVATRALAAYDAILVGAAATPAALLARADRAGARVVTTYGMSETCGGCVYDGRPLDGVGVHVDRAGRVVIEGPVLFSGYRLRPDLTAAALDGRGRLVTADCAQIDPDGRLRLLGRADDIIVTGGENVAPALVEDALATLPGVTSTVVVGVPDPQWGERVVALVVPRPGQTVRLADIRSALAGRLPRSALPQQVVLVGSLPVLGSGKPDRSAARALAAGHCAGHPGPSDGEV
jgi:o-succinylbenzoate---CoA ligase